MTRATVDLDFLLSLDDLKRTEQILTHAGYHRVFRSDNVSHYVADSQDLDRIDFLHAFRAPANARRLLESSAELEAGQGRERDPSGTVKYMVRPAMQ